MIPYAAYKVLHLTGVFMVIMSLGGVAMNSINGGTKANSWHRPAALTHGIGMLLVLVGGFGLLARLGFVHSALPPGWALAKFGIWLLLGGLLGVLIRRPKNARAIWFLVVILGTFAAYLANYKPF
jgi:hypothetical protein